MTHASLAILDAEHCEIFSRAVDSVLHTEIAEFTYAQLVDGLPTVEVFRDRYSGSLNINHPLRRHTELCPGVLETVREYREKFKLQDLSLSAKLLEAFNRTSLGADEFHARLVELVAVAVHQIAVALFQLDASLHKDDGTTEWMREEISYPDDPIPSHLLNQKPPDTLFTHPAYQHKAAYPDGVADMVGYWAENRILGGVVLFGRGESGFGYDGIYFHSDRAGVTFRIYKLLDSQVRALTDFLLGSSSTSPLPILGNKMNRDRVDPDEAIDMHHIYRDRWEREVPVRDYWYWLSRRDVENSLDYPEADDMLEAFQRHSAGP